MIKINNEVYKKKSVLNNFWQLKKCEERLVLFFSQKNNINPLLAKLLLLRGIDEKIVDNFLKPNIKNDLPNPFLLKDMEKSVKRIIAAINRKENIGIISDYDVDGSTSCSILFKFLKNFSNKIIIKIPDRLKEGYGPNLRIMDQMLKNNVSIIFSLDCGTSAFNIIDNNKYKNIDVIVIDHHLSEINLPKVYSIINPNRYDEDSQYIHMAAVGVTFLFLMALRKTLRENNFFDNNMPEPNLLSYLDLVALGTVCDVVNLSNYNRVFVKMGLNLIKERKNLGITKIIDNSNLYSTPTASDLAFIIGPQLNAASRIDDSSLPSKLLTSNNIEEVESISRKLILLNEKRKLIENYVFDQAFIQAEKQKNQKFILVHGMNWHNGVLGIVASRLISWFYKPTIVISFNGSVGIGSARSINFIDIGNIILNAKNKKILIQGGGHKMAAGFQITNKSLDNFEIFLNDNLKIFPNHFFEKIESFDTMLSVNEINNELLEIIECLEPFGSGNSEPKFIVYDVEIKSIKILKEKHILIFFQNDFSLNLRAICFNCLDTALGDYLLNFKKHKISIACTIKKDNFKDTLQPQIIIKDIILIN